MINYHYFSSGYISSNIISNVTYTYILYITYILQKTTDVCIITCLLNTTNEKNISCVQCDLPVRSVEHMLQHIKEEHGEEIDYIMVRGWGEEEASQG